MTHHEFGELPEGPLTVDTEKKFLKLKLAIQRDLMEEYMKKEGEVDDRSERGMEITQRWVQKYSTNFRKIFHKKIAIDPNFKEDTETIPDAVYEDIKLELYHEEGRVNPDEYIDSADTDFKKAA